MHEPHRSGEKGKHLRVDRCGLGLGCELGSQKGWAIQDAILRQADRRRGASWKDNTGGLRNDGSGEGVAVGVECFLRQRDVRPKMSCWRMGSRSDEGQGGTFFLLPDKS